MVLSPKSLEYARYALESLYRNALEPFHLHLITDSAADKDLLATEMRDRSGFSIFSKSDLAEREAAIFAGYPKLRAFRDGHPCWRKITDPLLLTEDGEEMVLLDPDLYFPNLFAFEPTPDRGVLLMWQRPNCLFPPEVVTTAIQSGISLANHVDIGVAHWRAPVDLDWIEWLIGKLGGTNLPRLMHIEAIVWAALAMRIGGRHLDPHDWRCWRRSQWKRVALKVGLPGVELLRIEPFSRIKCFHAGGEAKSWLAEANRRGWMGSNRRLDRSGAVLPFVELTPGQFRREQKMKSLLRQLGYYQAVPSA